MLSLRCMARLTGCSRVLRPANHRLALSRTCLTYSNGGAYEGDGKTTLTVLNRDEEDVLLIDSYSTHGFRINSGLFICGPAAFFPRTILSWDVEGPWDVSPESLSLFWLMEPKPDVLVIGVGDKGNTISDEVRLFMNQKKISLEVLDTAAACAAFNFMTCDHRNVAAALIPNQTMSLTTDSELWDNVAIKRRLFHSSGSSVEDIVEERERRMTKKFEDDFAKIEEATYEPYRKIEERDFSEMVARGMISREEVKRKYPYLKLSPEKYLPSKQADKKSGSLASEDVDSKEKGQ